MMPRPLVRCLLLLAAAAALSCGDGDRNDEADSSEAPAPTPCQQLEAALCERTTSCAVQQGVTPAADREVFSKRCLGALARELSCQESSAESADFELCVANLGEIPCDIVAANLRNEQLVVPSSSCGDFFPL